MHSQNMMPAKYIPVNGSSCTAAMTPSHILMIKGLFVVLISLISPLALVNGATPISAFSQKFSVSAGSGLVNVQEGGHAVQLTLTHESASGFTSINKYFFGTVSMRIKLVGGNSAGTVTAYYLSSSSTTHDEVDFEFLGNSSGQPYILQTNLFAKGVGGREMRHYLWFDPTADYHTYVVLWNHNHIVFWVDAIPIRVFANHEAAGMPYPSKQPMNVYASLWNGDNWATQGGCVKIDWASAPFMASFDRFQIDGCVWPGNLPTEISALPACARADAPLSISPWEQPEYHTLSVQQLQKLKWVQDHYIIYNYCTDTKRYPQPPFECLHPTV